MAADSLVARHRDMPAGRLGMAFVDPGSALSDRSGRRRGVDRRRAARRVRGHRATLATGAPPWRRATSCSASPSRPPAACAGPTGPIRTASGRRRTSRASTTARPGSATTCWRLFDVDRRAALPGGGAGGHALAGRAGRRARLPAESSCSWRWTDDPSWRVGYNGVGMGQAGIVLTLDAFADRTGDPTFRAYARAGAARLRELTADGTRPLPRGSENAAPETGFLSGSAGAAYMFLERYARDRDPADLATARGLLRWVNDQAVADASGGLSLADRRRQRGDPGRIRNGGRGHRVGQPAGVRRDRRTRVPRRRPPRGGLAAVRRDRRIGMGRAARRRHRSGPCRARQRGGRNRLGAGGPRSRGPRPGRQPGRRSVGARGSARRRAPRPPRSVLVRQPDRKPPSAACRTLVALGLGRDRRLRRAARRMVRQRSGRPARLTRRRLLARPGLGHHARPGLPTPEDAHGFDQPFRPMRPASGPKLIAALVLGPILWVVALIVASWLLDRTDAIELGLLIVAAVVRLRGGGADLLRLGRRREERRYADRA